MHNVVVRVGATDLARLHQLADDVNEPIAVVVRRWLREAYRGRFSDTAPRTPELKHGGRIRLPKGAR